jgi:hypothetical protein
LTGLCVALAGSAVADNRVSASKKGSLLYYSKVELQFEFIGNAFVLTQDTFLDLSNDFPEDVYVQLYFVNGDAPTDPIFVGDPPVLVERGHPGWNWVDCQILLTANQPTYWSAFNGLPAGCQPFTILDPGFPPGRPNPDFNSIARRVLRGFVVAWAVDNEGEEIRWNHLKGDAVIVNYLNATAWEYNAYSLAAITAAHGAPSDANPGVLQMNGVEYDQVFDILLLDFYAAGSVALSNVTGTVGAIADTDLTLHLVSADLRQDNVGPLTTKAKFDIWNEDEVRFSGTERCITCWDQTLLSRYDAPNHMLRGNLQTDKGKARIDGLGSIQCPFSVNAAILGVVAKELTFFTGAAVTGFAKAGMTLVGQGEENAVLLYDIIAPPDELRDPAGVIGIGETAAPAVKAVGRSPR